MKGFPQITAVPNPQRDVKLLRIVHAIGPSIRGLSLDEYRARVTMAAGEDVTLNEAFRLRKAWGNWKRIPDEMLKGLSK